MLNNLENSMGTPASTLDQPLRTAFTYRFELEILVAGLSIVWRTTVSFLRFLSAFSLLVPVQGSSN